MMNRNATNVDPLAIMKKVATFVGGLPAEDLNKARDAVAALVAAARELMLYAPAFRSRPLGSKGSDARILQDEHIAAEDTLRAALAPFESQS
jgi:hypothetical protein